MQPWESHYFFKRQPLRMHRRTAGVGLATEFRLRGLRSTGLLSRVTHLRVAVRSRHAISFVIPLARRTMILLLPWQAIVASLALLSLIAVLRLSPDAGLSQQLLISDNQFPRMEPHFSLPCRERTRFRQFSVTIFMWMERLIRAALMIVLPTQHLRMYHALTRELRFRQTK